MKVVDVVPGAWVDIYIDGLWRGRKKAGHKEVDVSVQVGVLRVDDAVTARQSLCGRMSETSEPPVRALRFDGRWFRVGPDDKSAFPRHPRPSRRCLCRHRNCHKRRYRQNRLRPMKSFD